MSGRDSSSPVTELQGQVRSLGDENVQIREKNEGLLNKPSTTMQNKLGTMGASKSDLSARLVSSEEEKLRMSKQLVEAQIAANKMREQYEAECFELKNKMFSQKDVALSLEAERDKLRRDIHEATMRLQFAEGSSRELAEEYTTLKRNFLSVCDAYDRTLTHTEKLAAEMLVLKQTHDAARDHAHQRAQQEADKTRPVKELRDELEKMKDAYDEQQRRLEEKVLLCNVAFAVMWCFRVAMGKDQQENKRAIRNTQHTLAEQSATVIISQHQLKEVEAENSQLQNKLKELNQEYRARLTQYLRDLADFMSDWGQRSGQQEASDWLTVRGYVDRMLSDVKAAHRQREEQLADAARSYKHRIQTLTRRHAALLSTYRTQREQILAHSDPGLEAGPPEAQFSVEGEGEEAQRELHNLRQDKARLESQLKQTRVMLNSGGSPQTHLSDDAWTDIRRQLRDISTTAQESWERERAGLITRATVAEEQVLELQQYVDNHLGRYKQEIIRLRSLLGLGGGRAHSAEHPKPRLLHKTVKNQSYEI
ncbi:coiled-coil domain-containing protein 78 isoform X1 [Denticeps clupeoides]|uniref:coiled-coil domain-containing protein 78 isoform X1 n=1 Tax=Denticeps clupeoides TaxID=299321 RepID=UPI0010A4533F|nr:coiled-coil domain-containing protein 78 isoform X1 [Denticeps clupeoides]